MYLIIIHNLCPLFLAMSLCLRQNDLWGSGGTYKQSTLMYTHLYTYTFNYDHEQYAHIRIALLRPRSVSYCWTQWVSKEGINCLQYTNKII